MNWTELLKERVAATYRATEGLLNLVDEDQLDWKPSSGENWMTTGQLALHLTNACGFCMKGFVTGDWGMPAGESVEDLPEGDMLPPAEKMPKAESLAQVRELFVSDRELAYRMIEEAGEDALENQRIAAPWGGPEMRLGDHLLDMVHHLDVHKAQLFYYLKLMGKPVNTMHLWGLG